MAAKKSRAAMEFLVDSLKADRNAVYKDVAAAAAKKKLTVYAVMWGRAKALLGYVKVAPRGQGKVAKAKAAAVKKRGPGRPPKTARRADSVSASASLEGTLQGIVAAAQSNERARNSYRAAMAKIQAIISAVIG